MLVPAPFGSFSPLLQRALRRAARVLLREDVAVAADLDAQLLGERVDDRDADAVQAAGDLVAAAVAELAAGVQHGQHDLDRRLALLLHHRDGDAAAVVDDGDRVVGVDRDRDLGAEAGQRLVDGVVDDLVDEVVQAHHAGRADVHARALADRLEALEDGDVLRVVVGGPPVIDGSLTPPFVAPPLSELSLPLCGQWSLDYVRTPRNPGVKRPAVRGEERVYRTIAHRGPRAALSSRSKSLQTSQNLAEESAPRPLWIDLLGRVAGLPDVADAHPGVRRRGPAAGFAGCSRARESVRWARRSAGPAAQLADRVLAERRVQRRPAQGPSARARGPRRRRRRSP